MNANLKVHTYGIKSSWKDAKKQLRRMAEIKRGYVQAYFDVFTWRFVNTNGKVDSYFKILDLIRIMGPIGNN